MADYLTMFSCTFDVGSAENAVAALALLDRLRANPDDDEPPYGFDAVVDASDPNVLWLSDGDGQGDPEHVIAFALACAEAFDLTGRWGFVWALTCSKPRLDGFGGGAQLIDLGTRKSLAWLDCAHWLQGALDPQFDAESGVARSALPGGEPAMGKGEPGGDDGYVGTEAPRSRRIKAPHNTPAYLSPPARRPRTAAFLLPEAPMPDTASDLARRLARDAEAVCRHYLPAGRREGRYWLVGDVENSPGRSLYVRLRGPESGKGAAGKWTDAATGEHGDLLDLIAAREHLTELRDILDEARRFLSLPQPERRDDLATPASTGSPEAARRLWAISQPIRGTVAETYFRSRGIAAFRGCTSLGFHPRCYYRADRDDDPGVRTAWPALIAAVTDLSGAITGVHRTWLDPDGSDKAPVATPRRAMGDLLGHGVRFGRVTVTMAAGEGVETMLSLRQVAPDLPAVAALSAAHLAALILPPTLTRLYIAEDADRAGRNSADQLAFRAEAARVEAIRLRPAMDDLNEDLVRLGPDATMAGLRTQFAPEDVTRFLPVEGIFRGRERAA